MLLVANAGSSSLKLGLFDAGLVEVATARVAEIGSAGAHDHAAAWQACLAEIGLDAARLTGVAHRVVHGGARLTAPCRITPAVMAAIETMGAMAPLHNPPALAVMAAIATAHPMLPQYASFDTAFHVTNPPVAVRYAIPQAAHDAGIRRYGFHGISYASLVAILREQGALPARLLALHLGNGASLCAIADGQSVATTMGYSPLDGLTMGTRAGGIDGNAVLALAAAHGIAGAGDILNRHSGLMALGGSNDMRALHGTAAFAVDHFVYWAVRHAGAMIAAMGGLDAMAFTGGIGENDPLIRARIVAGLGFMGASLNDQANAANARALHDAASRVAIWTVPAMEERQIAIEARQVMAGEGAL
jgi:acetate kinase